MKWMAGLLAGLLCAGPVSANEFADRLVEDWHGFVEGAAGVRLDEHDLKHDDYSMLETRLQLKKRYFPEQFLADYDAEFFFRADVLLDGYYGWETDTQVREGWLLFSPADFLDVKVGRQVFTWGTGDYIFVNDLFPKDYVSFLIGRDDEYLKQPSDGVKFAVYNDLANLDIVAIPFFEPNTLPAGDRLSFFDPFEGGIAGRSSDRLLIEPPRQASNTEYALRAYRTFGRYETAGYYFHGFYKNPVGYKNEALRQLYYPRLDVYGVSVRGPFGGGIGNLETGYYRSRDDSGGRDRLVQNSSVKLLAGYDRDLGDNLRMGGQYLYERTLDYGAYRRALLPGDFVWDEVRQSVTLRLIKQNSRQTLTGNLFVLYSFTDRDTFWRPVVEWKKTDNLILTLGANLIWGEDAYTEWGQFEENSNVFARVRYTF